MSGGHPTAAGGDVRGSACVRVREAVVPFAAKSRADTAQRPADGASAVLGGVRVWWMEVPNPVSPAPLPADGPTTSRPGGGCCRAAGSCSSGEPCLDASVRGKSAGCGTLVFLLPTW